MATERFASDLAISLSNAGVIVLAVSTALHKARLAEIGVEVSYEQCRSDQSQNMRDDIRECRMVLDSGLDWL